MERNYQIGLFGNLQGFAASVVSINKEHLLTIHSVETGILSQDSLKEVVDKMWGESKQARICLNRFAAMEDFLSKTYFFEVIDFDQEQDIGMLVYRVNNGDVEIKPQCKDLVRESLATCWDKSSINMVVCSLAIAIKDLRYSDGSGFERVGRNTRMWANLSDY
ncbi:hypothetical protein SD81_028280 [Tolypothrix campylonemoides VB511288]|nr:hypothetical protein SD81_028280 [Tolypothrix campylonemoides VB511288]